MRSRQFKASPGQARRAWEAPAMAELSIAIETKAARTDEVPGQPANPPTPGAPATKLGFAFEMSFPLSVRTE